MRNLKVFRRAILLSCFILMLLFNTGVNASAKMEINKSSVSIYVGDTVQLKTNYHSGVVWSSSNPKIAVVSAKGKVTAKKAGNVIITAKANGYKAKCNITIKKVNEKSLYKKFLEKNMINQDGKYFYVMKKFVLLDIDQNGVKDLIIRAYAPDEQYLYTVKKNKVVFVGRLRYGLYVNSEVYFQSQISDQNSIVAQGVKYNQKDRTIITTAYNAHAYVDEGSRLVGTKMDVTYSCVHVSHVSGLNMVETYGIKNKDVTKSIYDSYFNQHMGTYKFYRFIDNTDSNREKYLR